MRIIFFLLSLSTSVCTGQHKGPIILSQGKFNTADSSAWKDPGFPDDPEDYQRVAVSGKRTLFYNAEGLPEGLQINTSTGIITGSLKEEGECKVLVKVPNVPGKAEQQLTIKSGSALALTRLWGGTAGTTGG